MVSIDKDIKATLEKLAAAKPGPHRRDLERQLKNLRRKKRKETWQHSKQN